jgi:hypothetical protein
VGYLTQIQKLAVGARGAYLPGYSGYWRLDTPYLEKSDDDGEQIPEDSGYISGFRTQSLRFHRGHSQEYQCDFLARRYVYEFCLASRLYRVSILKSK